MLNHLAIANAIGDDEKKPVLDGFDQHLVIFFGYLPVLLWLSGPSLALLVVEGLAVLRVQTQGSFTKPARRAMFNLALSRKGR